MTSDPAARELTRLVNGVQDDQLDGPTPCSSYSLGDLLQHVRVLAEAFTVSGRKEQPPGGSQPPPLGDAFAARPPSGVEGDRRLGSASSQQTWADPAAWEGTAWIAGFEAPADAVGITAANEMVAHGWDVARASGQEIVARRGRPWRRAWSSWG